MTCDLAYRFLYAAYPAIKSYLSAQIPDVEARDRVERLVAGHHYIVGDSLIGQYYPVLSYGAVLGRLECDHDVRVDALLDAHNATFDQVIESAVFDSMASDGMQKHLLLDIFKSDEATHQFIECAKSFLLACTLKQSKSHLDSSSIAEQLRMAFFTELASLGFLKRFHLDWIRQTVGTRKKCVAFYCPDGAHRKQWDRLPSLLQQDGYAVLLLYGVAIGDELETQANAFYVGQGLIAYLDCVDLYVTETAVDGLPDCSKKTLLVDDEVTPLREQSDVLHRDVEASDESILDQYRRAVITHGALTAYFRLYDYFVAASPKSHQTISRIARSYGMPTMPTELIATKKARPSPMDVFNMALEGRVLPKQICVIPTDVHPGEAAFCELIVLMLRGLRAEVWDCMDNVPSGLEPRLTI